MILQQRKEGPGSSGRDTQELRPPPGWRTATSGWAQVSWSTALLPHHQQTRRKLPPSSQILPIKMSPPEGRRENLWGGWRGVWGPAESAVGGEGRERTPPRASRRAPRGRRDPLSAAAPGAPSPFVHRRAVPKLGGKTARGWARAAAVAPGGRGARRTWARTSAVLATPRAVRGAGPIRGASRAGLCLRMLGPWHLCRRRAVRLALSSNIPAGTPVSVNIWEM